MRAIKIQIFKLDGWLYEHFEYISNQHTYSKTEEGKHISQRCEKYEFEKAVLYGTEIKTTIRKAG